MPFTTRGLALQFGWVYQRDSMPAHFYFALCTAAAAPTHATKTLSELTEIGAGNGYTTGGYQLTPNATDFPTITEDDTRHFADMNTKDILFSAGGGDIPASGAGPLYMVLTTDEGTIGSRQVIWYASFRSARTVLSGQDLNVTGITARIQGGSVVKSNNFYAITFGTSDLTKTGTITAVDTSKSQLIYHSQTLGSTASSVTLNQMAHLTFTNSTTVTATRIDSNAQVGTIRFQVMEFF